MKNKKLSSKLNKIIDIYDYEESTTEEGISYMEYFKIDTVFSSLKAIGANIKELYIAMQLSVEEYYIFSIRTGIKVRTKMRIMYENNFFEIKKIIENDQLIQLITLKVAGD